MNGCLLPQEDRCLSEKYPTRGSEKASNTNISKIANPAKSGANPKICTYTNNKKYANALSLIP